MRLHSWINFLDFAFKSSPKHRKDCRPRIFACSSASAELLESRQLLAPVSIIPIGSETRVNTQTQNDQTSPVIAMDAAGDYVVAWTSVEPGSGEDQIRAQRYTAAGVAQGSEFEVSSVTASSFSPTVAMDNNGDFVIAYSNASGVFAQRFNSSGVAQGSQIAISATDPNLISDPKVAMDASGDFVVGWTEETNSDDGLIFARRFNAAGIAQGNEFQVGGEITGISDLEVGVAMNAQGAFVVTWLAANQLGNSEEFLAQRYDATGTAQGVEIFVNSAFPGSFKNPSVAMDTAGDFVISWMRFSTANTHQGGIGGTYGIYAQTFNAAGTPQVGVLVKANAQNADVAMDPSGDFVVTWQSYAVGGNFYGLDGSGSGIYAQRYSAAGQTEGNSFMVNTYTTGQQAFPSAALDSAGQFVIAWESPGEDGSGEGIYAQQFTTEFPPGISGLGESEVYLSGTAPIAVAPDVVVSLESGFQIVSATIEFTNWQPEDRVTFINSVGLQHTFDEDLTAHTATLTITGASSPANYQTLLRSVVYQDVSGNPNTSAVRTAQITVNNGLMTASGTQTIHVATTLLGLGQTTTYVSGSSPIAVAPSIAITLPPGGHIVGATVSFANWQPEDRLTFTNSFAYQHTFTITGNTATLTLTGADTAANYQTTLRSVVFQDVAGNPNTSVTRSATITINDGTTRTSGVQNVAVVTFLGGLSQTTTFVQGAAPLVVAPNVTVNLPDGQTVTSATISFKNFQPEDRLTFTNSAGLQHTLTQDTTAETAILTLTGTNTAAAYQAELRSISFQDVAGAPNTSITRVATIAVTSATNSGSGTQNVVVLKSFSGLTGSATFVVGSPPVAIAPNMVITLPTAQTIASATVSLTDWQPEDRLSFTNTFGLQNSITTNATTNTATLTLTGTDTIAHYQATLASVVYSDATTVPNTAAVRVATFAIKASDGSTQTSDPQNIFALDSARPAIDINDTSTLTFAAKANPLSIFTRALVTDPDSTLLTQLTIQITSGYQNSTTAGTDVLTCTNELGITGIFNATTGTLTLSGTAYVGYYREVLRTVTFQSTGTTVTAGTRVLTLIATDNGSHSPSTSIPVTRSVTVTG